jgi:uncharacterized OsmC-like protein
MDRTPFEVRSVAEIMSTFCLEHFPDDPSVTDETDLLRRIPPWHLVKDKNSGAIRISSAAFEDDDEHDPMSVYLASILSANQRDASSVLIGHEGFALASITAGLAREKRQTVHPDPLAHESSHAVVCGDKRSGGNKCAKKVFAKSAKWIISPSKTASSP